MKEGLAIKARWFLDATVGERMEAGVHGEDIIGSLLVEMERLERVLPRYKAIVRALAASADTAGPEDGEHGAHFMDECHYCGAAPPIAYMDENDNTRFGLMTLDRHDPSCPWRRARELQQGDSDG